MFGNGFRSRIQRDFVPTIPNGLHFWARADLGMTLNGSTVASWADQSNAAIEPSLAQTSGSIQPIFLASGINGLPDIQYTGTQYLSGSATLLGSTALTMFGIFKTSTTTSQQIWGMRGGDYHYIVSINDSGTDAGKLFMINTLGQNVKSPSSVADGNPHFFISTYDTVTGVVALYLDSGIVPVSSATLGTGAIHATVQDQNSVGVAHRYTPPLSAFFFTGQIPEVGAYNVVLSPTDILALASYLKKRAGI